MKSKPVQTQVLGLFSKQELREIHRLALDYLRERRALHAEDVTAAWLESVTRALDMKGFIKLEVTNESA